MHRSSILSGYPSRKLFLNSDRSNEVAPVSSNISINRNESILDTNSVHDSNEFYDEDDDTKVIIVKSVSK